MMEENNDIFLAGGDAPAYLAEPMHKNIAQPLFWDIHLVRTHLVTDFSTPLDDTPPPPPHPPSIPPVAYVLNG